MRVHGAHPNCEFLFDHYSLQTYFALMLRALHRFDSTPEILDACKGDHSQDCYWCGYRINGEPPLSEVATFLRLRQDLADAKMEAASWKSRHESMAKKNRDLRNKLLSTTTSHQKLTFKVSVGSIRASDGTKHLVVLDNSNRLPEASAMDKFGRLIPFSHSNLEYVQHEAKEWAEFLGVPEQATCECIMCVIPNSPKEKS